MSHNLCLNKMIQSFESYHNGESETNGNASRSVSEQYLKTTCYLALCLHVVNGCLGMIRL